MSAVAGLKKAPKWAWYVAGGIGLGGAAIQLFKKRDERTEALSAGDPASAEVGLSASPNPSIVVPPVIIPGNTDDGGSNILPLSDLYMSSIGQVVSGWQDVANGWSNIYNPLLTQIGNTNQQVIGLLGNQLQQSNGTLGAIAMAGPAPAATPTPIVVNVAPPPPAPAQLPVQSRTHTKDNGLHGNARKVWCMCGDRKVADGACWAENHPCT